MTSQAAAAENTYSREHPSPRYQQLLAMYQQMHVHGLGDIKPEKMFDGSSLPQQAQRVAALIKRTGAKTLLDYGCGKAGLYHFPSITVEGRVYPSLQAYWGVDNITLYDPAFPPYMTLPQGTFDGVVCTDVLEHCPEEDIPWILGELFGYAKHFVYANIACYPAKKTLPNGENAHCTVRPMAWWKATIETIARSFSGVQSQFIVIEKIVQDGAPMQVENTIECGFK